MTGTTLIEAYKTLSGAIVGTGLLLITVAVFYGWRDRMRQEAREAERRERLKAAARRERAEVERQDREFLESLRVTF